MVSLSTADGLATLCADKKKQLANTMNLKVNGAAVLIGERNSTSSATVSVMRHDACLLAWFTQDALFSSYRDD